MTSKPPLPVGRTNYNGYGTRQPGAQGISKLLLLGIAQISHVAAAPLKEHLLHLGHLGHLKEDPHDADDPSLWLYLLTAAILVLLGGAFAGLTIA